MIELFELNRKIEIERANAILLAANYMSDDLVNQWTIYRNTLQDMDTTAINVIFPTRPPEPTFPLSPSQITERTNFLLDKQQLKDQYLTMIARLQQIQAVVSPTNAQVIQAVKDEALYIERIMKVLKRIL